MIYDYSHFLKTDKHRTCMKDGCSEPRYSTHPNTRHCLEHAANRQRKGSRAAQRLQWRKWYRELRLAGATPEQACAGSWGPKAFERMKLLVMNGGTTMD